MSAHAIFYNKLRSKNFLFFALCFFCICLVFANIVSSQKYNVNMYGVMSGDSGSIINYLRHVWGSSLFNFEIETYTAEGRGDVLTKWENIKVENLKRIENLENATKLYPYSPELYYNLHLLYLQNGEKSKAKENLLKARQIDPSI